MPRVKKIVLKEDYEKNLRQYYEDVDAEYGSKRPEGDGNYIWDLIELDWARMSNAPSQADVEREKQEKIEAERLRREEIRKDGIRRRGAKSFASIDSEAERYRMETTFRGGLDEHILDKIQDRIRGGAGTNKLETILNSLTVVTKDIERQYETVKRLKITIGKLKTNVLNDYRDGDLDVLYEEERYLDNLKPILDSLFEVFGEPDGDDISSDNNSDIEN